MELPTYTTTLLPEAYTIHFKPSIFYHSIVESPFLVVSSLSSAIIHDIPVILTLIIKHTLYLDCYILIESLSAWNIRVQNVINW